MKNIQQTGVIKNNINQKKTVKNMITEEAKKKELSSTFSEFKEDKKASVRL